MKTFLCIDLEATCFDRETLGRDLTVEDMETIEIGVIALMRPGKVLVSFIHMSNRHIPRFLLTART